MLEALGIIIIEGDCPGSSYLSAELRIPIEAANQIAAARGWEVRFIAEGSAGTSRTPAILSFTGLAHLMGGGIYPNCGPRHPGTAR